MHYDGEMTNNQCVIRT